MKFHYIVLLNLQLNKELKFITHDAQRAFYFNCKIKASKKIITIVIMYSTKSSLLRFILQMTYIIRYISDNYSPIYYYSIFY